MPATTATTVAAAAAPAPTSNSLCALPPDIISSHVLTRLDGPDLGSAACCSPTLRLLSSSDHLWDQLCRSTWPSTASPLLTDVIPCGGARAFFSQAHPTPAADDRRRRLPAGATSPPPARLISAVDVRCGGDLIFSRALETETASGWFRCSPFRVDLLGPKEVVPTRIERPDEVEGTMTLSWIVVDPVGRRAVNLSSHEAVAVQRHWLTGEVRARYASILRGQVQCGIVVTCGESEGGGMMQVREVSMGMEDLDGIHLNGRDSLVILQGALEGRRVSGGKRVREGKRRYKEYVEMKRERRERKRRAERALDILCVAFGVSLFVSFWCFRLCR